MIIDTVYKKDSKGKIRSFSVEIDGGRYRTLSGVVGGAVVISAWTEATPKNVGTIAETTAEQQALLEGRSRLNAKIKKGYVNSIEAAKLSDLFTAMTAHPIETLDEFELAMKVYPKPVYVQPKLDGIRLCTVKKLPLSRRNTYLDIATPLVNKLFTILDEKYQHLIFDGELYNHAYKHKFEKLSSLLLKSKVTDEIRELADPIIQYHIYDVYDPHNPDLTFEERHELLKKIFKEHNMPANIIFVPTYTITTFSEFKHFEESFIEAGYEGIIVRLKDNKYEHKRSQGLLKFKRFITEEFPIINILSGKGSHADIAAKVIVSVDGTPVKCSIKASHADKKSLLSNKDEYIGKMATVKYFKRTEKNSLRFPQCIMVDRWSFE